MLTSHTASRGLLLAGLTVMLSTFQHGSAFAEHTIRKLSHGIPVTLQTDATLQTLHPNDPFEAELKENITYKDYTLPAGTYFTGRIVESKASRRWGRPGYVVFRTDQAVLPNGERVAFDTDTYRRKKSHHPHVLTLPQAIALQIPYSVASWGLTIPVTVATGANPYSMALAGQGLRMAMGSAIWLFRPDKREDPVPQRVAEGALDGSGVPRLMSIVTIEPNPDFRAGQSVKLYFQREELLALFKANGSSPQIRQPQPKEAVLGEE